MSAHAASGHNHLAGDPPRVVGGEKGNDRRNILHLPDAAEWRLLFIPCLEVRVHRARTVTPFRFDEARVYADTAQRQRENAGG